jgi:lipopolysaccharide export system permease protein
VFLSIVMIVTYHKINQYSQSVGALGMVNPFLALWTPFLVVGGLIAWMYHVTAHVPGGQPIGALERQFATLIRWLVGLAKFGRGQLGRVR